ncbi:MAG: L-threonylcarbamoyladenylate synthase [Sedimenticola sp.]
MGGSLEAQIYSETPLISHWKLREAARCFREGGIIAYPTEAVFGLGCDPLNGYAVEQLLALKQRPENKGVILIAADFDQLRPFVKLLSDAEMAPVFGSWPGPHTWLLPAADHLPYWLCGDHSTLAVRVTDHPIASALSLACKSPLVSTSANIAGRPPARDAFSVRRTFGGRVDHIVHASLGAELRPSTIRDASSGRLIRP